MISTIMSKNVNKVPKTAVNSGNKEVNKNKRAIIIAIIVTTNSTRQKIISSKKRLILTDVDGSSPVILSHNVLL